MCVGERKWPCCVGGELGYGILLICLTPGRKPAARLWTESRMSVSSWRSFALKNNCLGSFHLLLLFSLCCKKICKLQGMQYMHLQHSCFPACTGILEVWGKPQNIWDWVSRAWLAHLVGFSVRRLFFWMNWRHFFWSLFHKLSLGKEQPKVDVSGVWGELLSGRAHFPCNSSTQHIQII